MRRTYAIAAATNASRRTSPDAKPAPQSIQWIVAPQEEVDEVTVAQAVDLDGDGTHELIVQASYETSEEILLVRREASGFGVNVIYWAGC